ncbi:reductase [Erythrobacter jejuensis]|uniref:Reductase n=1 Tax=Parerythrobacter jejuensis TaxID=795812 RepID=A0A845AU70_9SPHN|nr:reductase [Parerythrobacter jejuensis]
MVVDSIAYDADDIARYDPGAIGRLIAISSASVYCDAKGRTLDEAAQNGFPDFPGPIAEDQATVAGGPETYSTRKIRMEQEAQERFGDRASILRPCAIHGPWSRHPREWWFVKRLLDGRTRIPLAISGQSRFQTTAARTIGEFACHTAIGDHSGIYNIADADSPSVREIGEAIATYLEKQAKWVECEDYPEKGVGRTPWSIPAPMLVSGDKAAATGFDTARPYRHGSDGFDWLAQQPRDDWRTAFPQLAAYPWDLFDYAAEDAVMDRL